MKVWPDIRTGTGEVVKNLKILCARWGKILWGPRFQLKPWPQKEHFKGRTLADGLKIILEGLNGVDRQL